MRDLVEYDRPDILKGHPNPSKIVQEMECDSSVLHQIAQRFRFLTDISIVSFWEGRKTEGRKTWESMNVVSFNLALQHWSCAFSLLLTPAQLVTKNSAIMDTPDEDIRMISKTHSDMCRFDSADDGDFRQVLSAIKTIQQVIANGP